jgi:hypothetical protein
MFTTQEWVLLEGRRPAVKSSQIINHLLINEEVIPEIVTEVYFAKRIHLFISSSVPPRPTCLNWL